MARTKTAEIVALHGDVSNSGEDTIVSEAPYAVSLKIVGVAPILFHRWQCDAVEAKRNAVKGSKEKTTDNVESYVYRNDDGIICLPGEYLRLTMIDKQNGAAKYRQDPRSPRKSALDLFRAGVQSLTPLAPLTTVNGELAEQWDFIDRRRVVVQKNAITRSRPGFSTGWSCEVQFLVVTPGLIPPALLQDVLTDAGRLVGCADFRPSFGRFSIAHFEILTD